MVRAPVPGGVTHQVRRPNTCAVNCFADVVRRMLASRVMPNQGRYAVTTAERA